MEQDKATYVNDREASRIIGVARQTLANWRHLQKGPCYVKGGRVVRYAVSDLLAYMEARKIGTQDQPKSHG
jgi:hypothetical protein